MDINKTHLFILGIGVLLLAIFFLLRWLHYRTMHIRRQLQVSNTFTNITHELLTPLTIISASVEKLRMSNPAALHEYDLIDQNIKRSVRLLHQIQEASKSQVGDQRLQVGNADVMQYIKETAYSIEPLMNIKQVGFTIRCKPESMMGWIDTDKIDKIIFNLLSNIAQYTGEGSQVILDVATSRQYDRIIIRISDDGNGIPQDRLRMEPGLAITHDLVLLHRGTIHSESIEGQGTTFLIELPINKESFSDSQIDKSKQIDIPHEVATDNILAESQSQTDIGTETTDENAHRILIVDDSKELLMLMKQLMQGKYHVLTATNGREALEVIHTQPLDLIVSDVMMPEVNGYELAESIKQDPSYAHLPIILLTTKAQGDDYIEALTAGADDVMAKPFKLRDLQLRIDNIIANRQHIYSNARPESDSMETEGNTLPNADEEYLQRAIKCVNEHINDADYDREAFATDMSSSVSTLYNKIRALTGKNVTSFVRDIRIKTACQLAKKNPDLRVSDIAYSVGFRDPKYFATSFKRVMGVQPKEYFDHLRQQDATPIAPQTSTDH